MARTKRTKATGISPDLTAEKAALIKGMLLRGDRQSDVASYFQINQGRCYEIKFGQKFGSVPPAPHHELPPPGPYVVVSKIVFERAKLSEDVLNEITGSLSEAVAKIRARLSEAV